MHLSMQEVLRHSQDTEANIIIAGGKGCQMYILFSAGQWKRTINPSTVEKFILHFSLQLFKLSFS